MQKKLIALAIAGLSGAAFAQSNVTIYGVADATYDNVSSTGATAGTGFNTPSRGRTTMNSSYVGFKGSEDLGGGMKAVFQIETGFNENNGAGAVGSSTAQNALGGTWANRDSYVGIAGNFGTLVAGVLSGPTRVVGAAMDVNSGATGIGANTALLGKFGGGNGAGAFDQRINNAIAYISPTWSGFHFAIGYLPNENRGSDASNTAAVAAGGANCTNPTLAIVGGVAVAACPAVAATSQANTTGWTLGGVYDNGPIFAALTWTQLKDSNGTSASGAIAVPSGPFFGTAATKATDTRAAFKYNFGQGTVGLMWDRVNGDISVGGGVSAQQTVWYLPVTFNLGNGKIIAQYGKANNISGSVTSAVAVNKDYSAKHFELGYEYSLSKRTTAKVLWSQITNSADARYDFLYGVSAPNTTTAGAGVGAGSDPRGLSVGIRHSF